MKRNSFVAIWISFFIMSHLKAKSFNLDYPHVKNQLIVKYKKINTSENNLFLNDVGAEVVEKIVENTLLIEFDTNLEEVDLLEKAKQLSLSTDVEYVEANSLLKTLDHYPNDPSFSDLWGMKKIQALDAWEMGQGSKDVVVAVIDSGVDYNHFDLKRNYWNNPGEIGKDARGRNKENNGIDDDGNGYIDDWRGWDFDGDDNDPMDDHRHGTHCAGTIGATGNNDLGVVGVNWKVSLVGIKFINSKGVGTLANAVKAIDYATQLGVFATNNSWGGGGFSKTLFAAIKRANEAEVLFIAAAGNGSKDSDRDPHYPSSYQLDNIIAVAASTPDDKLASFSHYGKSTVHLAAPGTKILSTVPNNSYIYLNGTSMATPHVTGAAALIKAKYPSFSSREIKQKILNTVDPVDHLLTKTISGGRLNLFNALENDEVPPGTVENIFIDKIGVNYFTVVFDRTGDDGDDGEASMYEVRISANQIKTIAEWESAMPVTIYPQGQKNTLKVVNLPLQSQGYMAIRARDNAGNLGAISESKSFKLLGVKQYNSYTAKSMRETYRYDVPWGLEKENASSNNLVFSDSPGTNYKNNQDSSLIFSIDKISSEVLVISFDTYFELENSFDLLYLEISSNDQNNWVTLDKYTGVSGGMINKNIIHYLKPEYIGKKILIRFRLKTDDSISRDGVKVDNIKIFGTEN